MNSVNAEINEVPSSKLVRGSLPVPASPTGENEQLLALSTKRKRGRGHRDTSFAGANPTKLRRPMPRAIRKTRLCWSRRELVELTGLCAKTIINLEKRHLLHRVDAGVAVALYTADSVHRLFGGQSTPPGTRASDVEDTGPLQAPTPRLGQADRS